MPRVKYMRKRGRPRKIVRRRPRGGIKQPVQFFKRVLYSPNFISVTAGTDGLVQTPFRLDFVPNRTEFTALYDQYMIKAIKVTLMPRGNSSDLGTAATLGNVSRVFSVLDYDDSNNPTSISQLCEYQNLKVTDSVKNHTRYLIPKFNANIAGPLGTIARKPSVGFLDVTDESVVHNGVKWAIQAPANGTVIYDLMTTYYLAFKNVR